MRTITIAACLAVSLSAAVVIDRLAVVVDRHAIKTSDIDGDVRLTEFLNRQNLSLDASARKQSAERLIDQQLIRNELAAGGYDRATDADAAALLSQIRRDRFAGSDVRLEQALASYGLTEDQLREELLWQLTVLRFIDQRFRVGVLVTDDDVSKYYDEHRTQFHAPLAKVSDEIRNSLAGEQVNMQFEQWLAGARKRAHIEYKTEALP